MAGTERFSFECNGFPSEALSVVSFVGTEGLSQLYEFRMDLVSKHDDLDLDDVQGGLGVFTLRRDGGDIPFHGVLRRFEQLHSIKGCVFYRAVLSPRLWRLTLTSHNQVFLDQSAPEFLEHVLLESRVLQANDFEFRLARTYPKREYVCQFNESHYQFLSRWLEREGMYFFFENTEEGEKLVVADHPFAHAQAPGQSALRYVGPKGLDTKSRNELCASFVCEQNAVAARVKVKDYNYRMPSVNLEAESDIDENGQGEFYVYGENCKSGDEARHQAAIRAEEARLAKKRYKGSSTAAFIHAGAPFHLQGHFRQDANAQYLPITVRHEGNQSSYLMAGLGRDLAGREAKDFYVNSFAAIPVQTPYRPSRNTPWPKYYGVMNAVVDGQGSGQYAELDDHGRYKVRLPFDLANRPEGKASSWVRMAQPYSGAGHGMHFPLHKGAEVLLTFIEGDLDRPVIAAAVSNFGQRKVVNSENAPANAIRSAGGNQLVMGDKQGQEFIGIFSPFHESGIAVGSVQPGGGGSIALSTKGDYHQFVAGSKSAAVVGAKDECCVGNTTKVTVGTRGEFTAALGFAATLGTKVDYTYGTRVNFGNDYSRMFNDIAQTGLNSLTLSGGIRQDLTELTNRARKSLWLGLGGALAESAGITSAAAPFGSDFLKNADMGWKYAGAIGGAVGTALVGGAMTGFGVYNTHKLAEELKNARNESSTGQIKLDNDGVAIRINASLHPGSSPKFQARIVHENVDNTITMKATPNSSIVLNENDQASIKLERGDMEIESKKLKFTVDSKIDLQFKEFGAHANGQACIKINQAGKIELA